MKQTKSN